MIFRGEIMLKETLTIALLKEEQDGSVASNQVYTMTRSEAIEKMAKNMFLQINKNDDWEKFRKTFPRNQFIWHAKAALNSLLEDKK